MQSPLYAHSEIAPLDRQPESKKILQDLVELRKKIGGLKAEAKKGGASFPVKSAKDLMDKLRKAADELGMVCAGSVVGTSVHSDRTSTDRGVNTLVTITHIVRFMSSDGSHMDFVGVGQGGDTQDKAGGKASTYAWKDAVVKALALPDAEMVDTDDEGAPFDKVSTHKNSLVLPPLKECLAKFSSVKNKADFEGAKNLVKQTKNWSPEDRIQLQDAATKAQLFLTKKEGE